MRFSANARRILLATSFVGGAGLTVWAGLNVHQRKVQVLSVYFHHCVLYSVHYVSMLWLMKCVMCDTVRSLCFGL